MTVRATGTKVATLPGWALSWAVVRVGWPGLMATAQAGAWCRGWRRLTDRMTRGPLQVSAALAAAVACYLFEGNGLALAVLTPAWIVLAFGLGRLLYPHTARGRARGRYHPAGFATWHELRQGPSAHAARLAAVENRASVAARVRRAGRACPVATALLPIREAGAALGRVAIGIPFGTPCYAPHRMAVGIVAPPQSLKALALDTPIATPTGWTTMGEIEVGDQVFDRDGKVCRVTGRSEIFRDHTCYDVTTNDGEVITANADHLWIARLDKRRPEAVHTTEVLARARSKKASIAIGGALDLPDAELPLDPYLLGAWLGDGKSDAAQIYTPDQEVMDRIASAGYTVRKTPQPFEWQIGRTDERDQAIQRAAELVRDGYSGRQARIQVGLRSKVRLPVATPQRGRRTGPLATEAPPCVISVQEDLRLLGVLGNKHIPDRYLRGSASQRLALLQGLIDSDGSVTAKGHIIFTTIRKHLAEQVRELVFTLGVRASINSHPAMLNGRNCGTAYCVQFTMRDAAWLPRKAERCRDATPARRDRYVTATLTSSVPTRCIAVDSPTRTYLAGRSLLPTHNTALMGHHVIDHPGAVLSTQTKPETYLMTAPVRAGRGGRVDLIDPDGLTGDASTIRWSPVTGAADPAVAIRNACALTDAAEAPGEPGDREWLASQAADVLCALLLIADVTGATMADVAVWASSAAAAEPARRLMNTHAARVPAGWQDAMAGVLKTEATRTRDAIMLTLRGATAFMHDPKVAPTCLPGPGDAPFDVATFLAERGAVYLVASDRKNDRVGPLFAAFTTYVFETAKLIAGEQRRLDPPLLLSLDEVALTIPMPLDRWIGDTGGRGIQIVWSAQSPSQLEQRWGKAGAETVWNATGVKVFAGGLTIDEDLRKLSVLTGTRELPPVGEGRPEKVPVLAPDEVRTLPRWHALLIHGTTRATLVRISPVWRRADVIAARLRPRQLTRRPALEAVPDQPEDAPRTGTAA